jgi:hypothetical protein
MKNLREELEQPDSPSRMYTSSTCAAISLELRRGGDPHKIARYFDVSVESVLKLQRRLQVIAAILSKKKEK